MSRRIVGESHAIRKLNELIGKVSGSKTNILVIGESGTGKELVAREIHDSGPLKKQPFIPVNCGAIPETLIESEMFGHKKGSFTGAVGEKSGLFEAANGGTLFLDEVGELPLSMQVKLLRAIQEQAFRKVGGTDLVRVDLRIIAATNRDLEDGIRKGTFREDLYYRLNVIQIRTPALRERTDDIAILAEHFLKKYNQQCRKEVENFSPEVMRIFEGYRWPGNVRELENVVERAVTLAGGNIIEADSLPAHFQEASGARGGKASQPGEGDSQGPEDIRVPGPDFSKGPVNLDEILAGVERAYLVKALEKTGGVKKTAAELLGITFRSIRYRLQKLGIEIADGEDD